LTGLTFAARFRNYLDLTQATNIEFSASALTGRLEQPILIQGLNGAFATATTDVSAVGRRQSLFGIDLTYRWRPLQQGLYRSFLFQTEVMHQVNERNSSVPNCGELSAPACLRTAFGGPVRDFTGAYAFSRWQVTTRGFIGARYDWVQDPLDPSGGGRNLTAGSGYFEWFPSEFSKLVAAYERYNAPGVKGTNRILLQASFALGPHKPHPF
jgi:hypothetical protein